MVVISMMLKNVFNTKIFQDDPIILLTHKDFSHAGSWTIFPVLLHLSNLNLPNLAWLFFLEDYTVINVKRVIKEIEKYDYNEVNFCF